MRTSFWLWKTLGQDGVSVSVWSPRLVFVFVLSSLFCLSTLRVTALHIYDREYLISIRSLVSDVRGWNSEGQRLSEFAFLAHLPRNICCTLDCSEETAQETGEERWCSGETQSGVDGISQGSSQDDALPRSKGLIASLCFFLSIRNRRFAEHWERPFVEVE